MKHHAMRLTMAAFVFGTLCHAASAADDKITLMVGGMEKQIYLPAKLAERLGYAMIVLAVVALAAEYLITHMENALLKWRPPQFTETGL